MLSFRLSKCSGQTSTTVADTTFKLFVYFFYSLHKHASYCGGFSYFFGRENPIIINIDFSQIKNKLKMQGQIIFGEFIYILAILQVKWKEKLWLLNLIQFKLFLIVILLVSLSLYDGEKNILSLETLSAFTLINYL